MRKFSSLTLSALAAAVMLAAPAAMAQQAGEFTVGVGAHVVSPKSKNGTLNSGAQTALGVTSNQIEVNSDTKPTLTFEYFIADNLGIEVLAALPFEHTAGVSGDPTRYISTKVLPPTVSVQYHFDLGAIKPFAGVGVNYTTFLSSTYGPVDTSGGTHTYSLKDSVGAAVHLGTDIALNDQTSLRLDARWIDISSDLKVSGLGKVAKVELDPIVVGFAFVHKF